MIIHMKKVRQPKNLRLFKKNYAIVYFFLITPNKDYITCFFFFLNLYHCFFFFLDLFPIYITTLYFSKETHRFKSFLTKGFSNNASTIILTKKVCQPKNLRLFKKKNYVTVCFFLITPKKDYKTIFLKKIYTITFF